MLFLLFLLNVHSVIILLLLKANCSFSAMGINMGIFNTEEPTVNAMHLSDNISTFHLLQLDRPVNFEAACWFSLLGFYPKRV